MMLCLLLLLPVLGLGAEAGADWIANERVRVRIQSWPVGKRWEWQVQWREPDGSWGPAVTGCVLGNGDREMNARYRKAWDVYYLLRTTIPSEIRTSVPEEGAQMDLHIQREDLWLDLRIRLPGDGPFVVFECTGRSHPELRCHTRHALPATMLYLTGDAASYTARDRREAHVYASFTRTLFAWRPDHSRLYGLLTLAADQPQRSQWPPGGYGNVYLDTPYILWSANLPAPRDDDRLREYGTALWQQAQWQLPGRRAQPEEARP